MTLPPIPITRVQPEGKWLHQRRAFWFAHNRLSAMLAITMGGGKTKTAIDLLLNWKSRDVLIIAPQKAIDDAWDPQLLQHMAADFSMVKLDYGPIKQRTALASSLMNGPGSHRIVLINWEAFWREPFRTWALKRQWDLVIADESHRGKSAGSKQSRALGLLGSRAKRRLALTGTPMPHSPLDVYGQFRFLDPTIFGTNVSRFRNEYAEFGGWEGRVIIGYKNLERLKAKFNSIAIQIDDSEQGLPEVAPDIYHHVDLEPEARKVYTELDREFTVQYKSRDITAANAGVKLLRLHEIASGHLTYLAPPQPGVKRRERVTNQISTAKLIGLAEVLEDVNDAEPVVIFVRFTADIAAIYDLMIKLGRIPAELSGAGNDLTKWKAGKADVLVAQIQTVKEGIDLTRSAFGIFYSTGLSLGDYLQCRKRLHRPPQQRMVRFVHILARATRDITTMRALRDREDVIRATLRGAETPPGDRV